MMRARWTKALGLAGFVAMMLAGSAAYAAEGVELPEREWSFYSMFGTYERDAQQRGFLVYKNVCSSCHGLRLLAYRSLMDIGFTEDEVKAIAAEYSVLDGPKSCSQASAVT